jgi:Outer membrane protein beta-barrel domain
MQFMKNILFSILFIGAAATTNAQFFSFGLKGGANTQAKNPRDIFVNGGDTSFNFGVDKARVGAQFGAYMRLGNKFFVQPEVLFNSTRTDYKLEGGTIGDLIKNEKYKYLDIPLLIGYTFGPIRIHGGPVGHLFVDDKSELTDIKGYESRFKEMTWGWLGGITVGKGRVSADLRYEGNFSKQGNHINFFGDQYNFSNNPSRLVFNLNFKLI